MQDARVEKAWLALKITLGGIPVVAGLDKFFNLLAPWEQYLSPMAKAISPISDVSLMHAAGIVEISVGLMILTRWTRPGAYIAAAWLVLIALNLLTVGRFFDIAARDVALAVAAMALAHLDEARAERRVAESEREIHTLGTPAHG
jgi:uncharacterized membrane protein YphA (DoxX/SURF4 family)